MAQVAVIQRHVFQPDQLPRVLYLRVDTPSPQEKDWTEKRLLAFEFSSHGLADDFSIHLRENGVEHVHAITCEKPIPLRPPDESLAAENDDEHVPLPAPRPRVVKLRRRRKKKEAPPIQRVPAASPVSSDANKFWWKKGAME